MALGIILIVIGVAAAVACRAYVHEPVLKAVGVIVGVVVALLGLWYVLVALFGHSGADTDVDLDGAPAIVRLAA